jgi:hypothetical protein
MSKKVKININIESRARALRGNYKRCTIKDVHPHINFKMSEYDPCVWYFIMGIKVDSNNEGEFSGDNDEFLKGQFFGKITATPKYPFEPPNIIWFTPTGIFNTDDFCTDIGKYHKENYPAELGMDGYTKMMWSGLIGWKDLINGINLLNGKLSQKELFYVIKKASHDSQEYNIKYNSTLVTMFQSDSKKE